MIKLLPSVYGLHPLLSPLGHMSIAGILDVVVNCGAVVRTVAVGIKVIRLEIDMASLV